MEIWKDIKDYEGLYQVSNLGNVKSLDRLIVKKGLKEKNNTYILKGNLIKQHLNKGYFKVQLTKNSFRKSFFTFFLPLSFMTL